MSNWEIPKNQEYLHEKIETGLDQLENKILDNLAPDVYEKNPDGTFNIKLHGEKLDIDLKTPEQLVEVLKLTLHILQIYRENGYNPENNPFYEDEAWISKGLDSTSAIIDIRVDNLFNTLYLTESAFIKVFKENPRRWWEIVPKYVAFLNSVAWKDFHGTYELKSNRQENIDTNISVVLQETEHEIKSWDTMYSIINKLWKEVAFNTETLVSIRDYIRSNEPLFENIKPWNTVRLTAYEDRVMLHINHTPYEIKVKTKFMVNWHKLELED